VLKEKTGPLAHRDEERRKNAIEKAGGEAFRYWHHVGLTGGPMRGQKSRKNHPCTRRVN